MATEHVVMAGFADALRVWGLGEFLWELDASFDLAGNGNSWKTNEQNKAGVGQSVGGYYWTYLDDTHDGFNGRPNVHHNHHTATSGFTPYIKNSSGQTKANVWAGMRRGDRLYQFDGGVPTICLASAGPADYSAGNGRRDFMELVTDGDRFSGPQTLPDTGFFGNRYSWNTEWVALGDGSPVDEELWNLMVEYNACLADYLSWTPWQNGGHYDHTKRKIDLWVQHGPYSVSTLQDEVAKREGSSMAIWSLPMHQGDGISDGENVDGNTTYADKDSEIVVLQLRLNDIPRVTPKLVADGEYGTKTSAAVVQIFGEGAFKDGRRVTGRNFKTITDLAAVAYSAPSDVRWVYPKQSEPPASTDAEFILESFQVLAVKADTGSTYDGATPTTSFLADNGITLGVWDDAFVALLAKLCPWSFGTSIGPREEARLVASQPGIKGDTGATGAKGAKGAKGDPGTVQPGTVLELATSATVTEIT